MDTAVDLDRRQDIVFADPSGHRVYVCDKNCQTAEVVKWVLLIVLLGLFFFWLFFGYWHARRRIRKGMAPLTYHRWLAPRAYRVPQNNYAYYAPQQGNAYPMNHYPEPPPVYQGSGMPPAYQPPPGGSKVAPQQNGTIRTE